MGWPNYKLKSSHVKIAMNTSRQDPFLDSPRGPDEMLDHYIDLCRQSGYKLIVRRKSGLRLSKVATTYYTQIRLPSNWHEMSVSSKAILMAHEWRHTKQWRSFGRGRFAIKYIASLRFRAATEIECYCESARAMKSVGRPANYINAYIEDRARKMVKFYMLRQLRFSDFDRRCREAMQAAVS